MLILNFSFCRRYFVNDRSLEDHFKTKVHKRRLKALEDEPYSLEEAERAAGHGNWVGAKKRKISTLRSDTLDSKDTLEETTEPKQMRVDE